MFTENTTASVRRIFHQSRSRFVEREPDDGPVVHRERKPVNVEKRRIVAPKGEA